MKVVLDACVPEPFRHELSGHDVATARFLGINEFEDADLISTIEADWDVLVTCDRGIPWQNRFAGRNIAVIVMRAPTNKLQDLVALVPWVLDTLEVIQPGEVREVSERQLH